MRNRIIFAILLPFLLWALLALVFLAPLPVWLTLPGAAIGLVSILRGSWRSNFGARWLLAAAAVAVTMGVYYFAQKPRAERDWIPEQDRLARIDLSDDIARITNFRSAKPGDGGTSGVEWEEAVFRLDELERVDFVQSILSPNGAIAHGFLSFGFSDGRYLAVSVEARRGRGQTYSALRGLFRNYELFYLFGEETDLIGRRAAVAGDSVYLYPVRASPERVENLFRSIAKKANRLADQPEFYHTINNNCVTTLLNHANERSETPIGYDWRILFPGFADSLLLDLGLLDFDGSLAEARQRFLINDRSLPLTEPRKWSAQIRQAPPQGGGAGAKFKKRME